MLEILLFRYLYCIFVLFYQILPDYEPVETE